MTGSRYCLLNALFIFLLVASASALSISSSVDRTEVELGDPITLSVSVTGEGGSAPDPVLPDLSDFEVYSSGKNTSISIINGKFSSTLELSYVLVPKKMGVLTIGPVIVKEKNNIVSTNPIQIDVKKPGIINPAPPQGKKTERTPSPNRTEDFFIDQTVNKKDPYVGEQVTLTFRFYQAENLWEQPTLEWPGLNGFTVEDLPPIKRSLQYVNGRQYRITEIKRALFPITSGEIIIDSPRLTIKEDVFDGFVDPFNMFRRSGRPKRPTGPQVLTADPIKLMVKSLPVSGKPDNFNGAVGSYKIRISLDKDSIGVDEPITMKVILSGSGNIKSLPPISIPEMPDFRIYESGKTESINNSGGVISGSRIYEQAVIPVTPGRFRIPIIKFSFFDTDRNSYRTIQTEPMDIIASGEVFADLGKTPPNIIGAGQKSFAYIITDFPGSEYPLDLFGNSWFWILQFVPVLGVAVAIFLRLRYLKVMGDNIYARRITARKRLKLGFKSALRKKKSGDIKGFYGELYSSIVGFIADRLNLEKSALTVDDIGKLDKLGKDRLNELVKFLNICLDIRFAPGVNRSMSMDVAMSKASDLTKYLERNI